jgi:hypothetical protein
LLFDELHIDISLPYAIIWPMALVADLPARRAPDHRVEPPNRDQRIAVAEMSLCMLSALEEIGMRFAMFLADVIAPSKGGPKWPMMVFRFVGDPVTAMERVWRAVCLAGALMMRMQDEIAALRAGRLPTWPALAREAPRPKATHPKSTRISELAEAVAAATGLGEDLETAPQDITDEVETPERPERLLDDHDLVLRLRLEDPVFCRLLEGPLKDAVAAICADLGLKPDWSLWTEDGFPPPGGGEEEDWIAFFAPEGDTAPAPAPNRPPPPTAPRACVRDPGHVLDPPRRDLNAFLAAHGVKPLPPPPHQKSACKLPPAAFTPCRGA